MDHAALEAPRRLLAKAPETMQGHELGEFELAYMGDGHEDPDGFSVEVEWSAEQLELEPDPVPSPADMAKADAKAQGLLSKAEGFFADGASGRGMFYLKKALEENPSEELERKIKALREEHLYD